MLEIRRMLSSCRFLDIAAIAAIMVTGFSQFGLLPCVYGSNKPVLDINESGTIVLMKKTENSAASFGAESAPGEVALQALCEEGICPDLYPEDGTIEGKKISQLNPAGVNSLGQIVGLCILEEAAKHFAFVREPDGRFWLFKTPSSTGQGEFTDISDSGRAVGFYEKEASHAKIGFLMNSQGQWEMDIEYPANPCPSTRTHLHTQPNGINDNGEIVGNYDCTESPNDAADPLSRGNGFYRASNGTYYRVQFEDAERTVAGKISNTGVIVGYYVVDSNTWRPFAALKEDVIQPIVNENGSRK
jgi:hypothetical protein